MDTHADRPADQAGALAAYAAATEELEALARDRERLQALYQDACFAADVLARTEAVFGAGGVATMESLLPTNTACAAEPFVRVSAHGAAAGTHARLEALRQLLAQNTRARSALEHQVAALEAALGVPPPAAEQ